MDRPLRLHRRGDGRGEVAVLTTGATDTVSELEVARVGPYRLLAFDCLGSTNDAAMARLRDGDPGGFLVVAGRQTRGRGRHGRGWTSPPGNLYASLALVDPAPPAVAPQLGFVVGLALAQTLRAVLAGDDRLRLKWPNDALFAGAKLAGLLIEATTLPGGRMGCAIGIGVNCVSHPPDLDATDLCRAGASRTDPLALLADLAARIDNNLALWRRGAGFAAIRSGWMALAAGIGTAIEVKTPQASRRGTFREIDGRGRLCLESDGIEIRIEAGEVFLLPSAS